jgi:hypothetical protein
MVFGWLALDYLPRESIAVGARAIAPLDIPLVSDLATLDVRAADQLWTAVNGDELGLTTKQRIDAAGEGYIATANEAFAVYSIAVGVMAAKDTLQTVTSPTGTKTGIRGAPAGTGSSGGPTAGKTVPPAVREAELESNMAANPRGHYWCENCKYENTNPTHFDVDHIVPKSEAGNLDPKNLRVLCVGCNRSAQEGWPPKPGSDWATKYPERDMRP